MDDLRFAQVVHQIKHGGIPNIEHEEFSIEQKKELVKIFQERSDESLSYLNKFQIKEKLQVKK